MKKFILLLAFISMLAIGCIHAFNKDEGYEGSSLKVTQSSGATSRALHVIKRADGKYMVVVNK